MNEPFTALSNDWTAANWNNGSDPAFDSTFDPAFVTFNAGALVLKNADVVANGDDNVADGLAYTGSHYQTDDKFGYGTYEIVMKATRTPGLVSTFFLYEDNPSINNDQEIDLEFTGTNIQFTYVTGPGGKHEKVCNLASGNAADRCNLPLNFDASAAYHSYKIVYRSTSIAWLVDNVEKYSVQRAVVNHCLPYASMKVMMNIWVTDQNEWPLGTYPNAGPVRAYYDTFNFTPSAN